MPATHVVTNQVPPLENYNPATSPVLAEALIREGGQWGIDEVTELGALSGSRQAQRWGELANQHRPVLRTHDKYGHRIDEVEYDPAYHELMQVAIGHGLHAAPWADDRPGAHVVRAAKTSVWTPEPGHICPISMTYAVVPALHGAVGKTGQLDQLPDAVRVDEDIDEHCREEARRGERRQYEQEAPRGCWRHVMSSRSFRTESTRTSRRD